MNRVWAWTTDLKTEYWSCLRCVSGPHWWLFAQLSSKAIQNPKSRLYSRVKTSFMMSQRALMPLPGWWPHPQTDWGSALLLFPTSTECITCSRKTKNKIKQSKIEKATEGCKVKVKPAVSWQPTDLPWIINHVRLLLWWWCWGWKIEIDECAEYRICVHLTCWGVCLTSWRLQDYGI